MMKNIRIVMICLLVVVAVCLCALLGIALSMGGKSRDGGGEYTRVQEWELPAEEIRHLKVNVTFQSVYFHKAAGDEIVIRQYADYKTREGELARVEQNGAELLIKGRKNHFSFFSMFQFFNGDSYLEIYLPESFAQGGGELLVGTTSGDILADLPLSMEDGIAISSTSGDLELGQLMGGAMISTTSGEITVESLTGDSGISSTSGDISIGNFAGDGTISTTSGEITLGKARGDLEFSTTSGDVMLEEAKGGLEFSTTSGNVTVGNGEGGLWAETTSGDVELDQWDGNVSISTTSGEVSMALPKKGSFALDFDTVSGDCDTFFDEALNFGKDGRQVSGQYGGGEDVIEVSTTSGDLYIGAY